MTTNSIVRCFLWWRVAALAKTKQPCHTGCDEMQLLSKNKVGRPMFTPNTLGIYIPWTISGCVSSSVYIGSSRSLWHNIFAQRLLRSAPLGKSWGTPHLFLLHVPSTQIQRGMNCPVIYPLAYHFPAVAVTSSISVSLPMPTVCAIALFLLLRPFVAHLTVCHSSPSAFNRQA